MSDEGELEIRLRSIMLGVRSSSIIKKYVEKGNKFWANHRNMQILEKYSNFEQNQVKLGKNPSNQQDN